MWRKVRRKKQLSFWFFLNCCRGWMITWKRVFSKDVRFHEKWSVRFSVRFWEKEPSRGSVLGSVLPKNHFSILFVKVFFLLIILHYMHYSYNALPAKNRATTKLVKTTYIFCWKSSFWWKTKSNIYVMQKKAKIKLLSFKVWIYTLCTQVYSDIKKSSK